MQNKWRNIPFRWEHSQRLFSRCTKETMMNKNGFKALRSHNTFSIFGQPSSSVSCPAPLVKAFSFGSIFMATSRNSLSRNGTRASNPHAIVDLSNSVFRIAFFLKVKKRTCLREGSQRYEDFLRDEHILGEMMHDPEQRESRDSLTKNGYDQDTCAQAARRYDKKIIPPKISSLPSPLSTIFTPMALIFRLRRYIGVLARTVVTS
jgi:hypothetical protein